MLFVVAVGLIMAWKVAGYIGLDYFLLPLVGAPWRELKPGSAPRGRSAAKVAHVEANATARGRYSRPRISEM